LGDIILENLITQGSISYASQKGMSYYLIPHGVYAFPQKFCEILLKNVINKFLRSKNDKEKRNLVKIQWGEIQLHFLNFSGP
jgi:hypothetical protein